MANSYLESVKDSNIGDRSISTSIFQSLMGNNNYLSHSENQEEESELLDELNEPVIEDEKEEHPSEYPEMVKRSCLIKYEKFPDSYLAQLKVTPLNCDIPFNVNKNCEINEIEVKLFNSDLENNTRWPVNSTIMCISPHPNCVHNCTKTIKEIRSGVYETLKLSVITSKKTGKEMYTLTMIDEYGTIFGEPFSICINTLDADIVNSQEEISAFDEPRVEFPKHQAEIKYSEAINEILGMGFEVDTKVLDLLLKFNGDLTQVVDSIM